MPNVQRINSGQPIREAMSSLGLSIPKLAEATRKIDPSGRGVAQAAVGFLVTEGRSAREHCRPRTAQLIADALGHPIQHFFTTPSLSTSTEERSTE